MKFSIAILVALATTVQAGCSQVAGNYYCSPTKKVTFSNVGFSGSYSDVTGMDETTGQCSSTSLSFNGNLAPLDEELSVHFRGPIRLVQFGVYYPSGSNSKREDEEVQAPVKREEDCDEVVRHAHHAHKRATAIELVTSIVLVDAQGNPVTSAVAAPTGVIASGALGVEKAYRPLSTSSYPTTTTATSVAPASSGAASGTPGSWTRSSYYTPGTGDNVTFLNNNGGQGSGVWSATFGNSLSYCNADNSGASSTPVILSDVTLPSNKEFVIFSKDSCTDGNPGCGFYRSGTPAFHGFGGSSKIFVFEFEMPSDVSGGFNGDMPAVWLLNAKIPRTLQYGSVTCSCWATGCGELDLFEILSSGSNNLITTLHDGQGANGGAGGGGGSSDYFARPTTGTFKGAAIFTGRAVHVLQLDDSTVFGGSLDKSIVDAWIAQEGSQAILQG